MVKRNGFYDFIVYSLLLSGSLLLDQISKLWAYTDLKPQRTMVLIENVISLTYRENTGAAFSILEGKTFLLSIVTIAVTVAILYIVATNRVKNTVAEIALVFIAAGGVGNCIDRLTRGFVVDMFEFTFINFAIFNVADIFVTCGSVVFILIFMITKGEVIKWK